MRYNVRYLPLAVHDLDALAAYLSTFYPSTTRRALDAIKDKISSLQNRPRQCQVYDDDPFYRRAIAAEYLIFYHINDKENTIDIHRVLRGSWNLGEYLPNNAK